MACPHALCYAGRSMKPSDRPALSRTVKRRIVAAGFALLTLAAFLIWLWHPAGPPDPVTRGKPLSVWLDDRRATPQGPEVLSEEALAAVRALGPKAVPTLLAWIREPDSAVRRNARVVLEWQLGLPVQVPTHHDNRVRAMYGVRALGLSARSVFPALVAIALHSPDEWQRGDAINALTGSDAATMRRLAAGLESADREVRLRAIHALSCLRIAPGEVILPALDAARDDPDPQVRAEAAKAIAFLGQQRESLTALLTHHDPEMRASAARLVGGYRARASLPALEAAGRGADPRVRAAAAEAIRQIAGPAPLPAR